MQIDFHFGMIYVLARGVGINHNVAYNIARASQYVDDSKDRMPIRMADDTTVSTLVTSYDVIDVRNFTFEEGWRVWAPFHFLPKRKGQNLSERLVCMPDSESVNMIIKYYKQNSKEDINAQHLGIILHVIADTYSHQDFNGFLSDLNGFLEIENIEPKHPDFSPLSFMHFGEFGKFFRIGHAWAGYKPDIPFLKWRYKKYGDTKWTNVDNPDRVEKALDKCFHVMLDAAENHNDVLENNQPQYNVIEQMAQIATDNKDESKEKRLRKIYELLDKNHFGFTPKKEEWEYFAHFHRLGIDERNELKQWHESAKKHQYCVYSQVYEGLLETGYIS